MDAHERPQAERLCQVGKDYSEMAPRLAEWPEAGRMAGVERARVANAGVPISPHSTVIFV